MTRMAIKQQIQRELDKLEEHDKVSVLYACESGSRAWGFESDDSDYDVRFIYLRPTHWYLTIQNRPDVIEKPIDGDLDIAGWDLPKALELFRKSNPPLLEWLQSPIVYRERSSAVSRIKALMPDYYSPISCMFHYLHMAKGNFRKYLKGPEVRLKKYFYVLRPVLACMWIENGFGAVPMEFQVMVDRVVTDPDLKSEIEILLNRKKQGAELDKGPRNPVISDFLEAALERLSAEDKPRPVTRAPETLDLLFKDILIEVNGLELDRK